MLDSAHLVKSMLRKRERESKLTKHIWFGERQPYKKLGFEKDCLAKTLLWREQTLPNIRFRKIRPSKA